MVGRHHELDGHEFEQAPGAGEGQGELHQGVAWCATVDGAAKSRT